MRLFQAILACTLCVPPIFARGQQISAPEPKTASIIGTVTDDADGTIPGATAVIDGPAPSDHATATANDNGFFVFKGLHPATLYHIAVSAKGFATWNSPDILLKPGQDLDLAAIKLRISVVETTVAAATSEEIATQQVQVQETQRIVGFIPNFYVTYEQNPAPMTAKLKYKLAIKTSTDAITFAGAAFIAAIDQAADTPDYQQGFKGFGQRFGATYADGASNILIGGAILPSLLHQDPRYYYRGTGTTKARMLHAISSPFWCRNDDGHWGINYSSIGGNLGSAALANLYYPDSNRGVGLTFGNAAITFSGQIANTLAQEFIFRKFTHSGKKN